MDKIDIYPVIWPCVPLQFRLFLEGREHCSLRDPVSMVTIAVLL